MKLRRILLLGAAFFLVLLKFAIDVVAKNVALGIGGLGLVREAITVAVFGILMVVIHSLFPRGDVNPVRRLGLLLGGTLVTLVGVIALGLLPADGFDAKELSLMPLDYPTLFVASLASILLGVFSLMALRSLRDMVLLLRRKGTERNYLIFVGLILATALSTLLYRPLENGLVTTILFVLAVLFAVMTSFRLPWIVYLSKREKIVNLVFSFFLFFLLLGLNVYLRESPVLSRAIIYYSRPLAQFVVLALMFATVYAGMAFVSTLFHLPTAEAFDRKRSEISSVHTLSKLVTQVLDFDELVETVTSMTLQVCEAHSCWLEIQQSSEESPAAGAARTYQLAGVKNIGPDQIDLLHEAGLRQLRETVLSERRPILVNDLRSDERFPGISRTRAFSGALVVVPLVSHVGPVGVLYAIKKTEYGFVKDDVDVISTFADQATVAIENARLVNKSIERERLAREMHLAREMQRKLLPQELPRFPTVDIDAVSTPAFEVGGDYYDFMKLDDHRLGIIVGDVSGKGVPAAFYMSEVKGIFLSLCKLYHSPREFMIRANEVLGGSIDKHSFVSLLYAVLDTRTGHLVISRAGHCPMLYVSGGHAEYLRPDGIGLGLGDGIIFGEAIREHALHLQPGDVCVLYTDGITEAHANGDEYGYERLLAVVRDAGGRSAAEIKTQILDGVSTFIHHQANHDDLTLVVIKWLGSGYQLALSPSQSGGSVHERV